MNNYFSIKNIDKIPILIIIIASVIRLYAPAINTIMLMVVLPILMIWCYKHNPGLLRNFYLRIYWLLFLWMIITTIGSFDFELSLKVMKTIFGGVVFSCIFYHLSSSNKNNVPWLLISYFLTFVVTVLYLYQSGALLNIDVEHERLTADDVGINANDIAYYLFYITIGFTIIGWNGKNRLSFFVKLLFILLLIITLMFSILTASRQVIIVVIPFIVLSYLVRQIKKIEFKSFLSVFIPLFIVGIIVFVYFMANYYEGSFLETRMDKDVAEDSRATLLLNAIICGLNNPILGVGPGCYVYFSGNGSFSHCSYTELFATSGFLALLLFFIMLLKGIMIQYNRYKKTKNRLFGYLTVVLLMWSIYNVLYAFYTAAWLIAFYFLIVGYSDCYYNELIKNEK